MNTMPLMIDSFSVEEHEVENAKWVQCALVPAGGGRDPKWPIDADVLVLVLPLDQARRLSSDLQKVVAELDGEKLL